MESQPKPFVWQMVKEAVEVHGNKSTNTAIRDWILEHYPGVNVNTIQKPLLYAPLIMNLESIIKKTTVRVDAMTSMICFIVPQVVGGNVRSSDSWNLGDRSDEKEC